MRRNCIGTSETDFFIIKGAGVLQGWGADTVPRGQNKGIVCKPRFYSA